MSSSGASSDGLDEGHFDSPHAFWVNRSSADAADQVTYNWKKEGWELPGSGAEPVVRWQHIHQIVERPLQPAHSKARQHFKRLNYPALPDEDLGFFYDPSQVEYRATLRVATRSADEHPSGLTPKQQVWEVWNFVQSFCMGCRVQQFRGQFYEDEATLETASQVRAASGGRLSVPAGNRRGHWAFDNRDQAPIGPYIATDLFGGWKSASPVSSSRYNEILKNCIANEIKHRTQNIELSRSRRDPFHWRHSVKGVPTYHHPLVGSWTPAGRHPDEELFQTTMPPLSSDFLPSNPSQALKGWLELQAEREQARARAMH